MDKIKKSSWFRKKGEPKQAESGVDSSDSKEKLQKAIEYYANGVYDLAVELFSELAEQGDSEAQSWLGECYCLGKGVNQDYTKAVEWYRKSAEQGDSDAQCMLGLCYYLGKGVNQDYTKAVEWYRKSAEQGDSDAQFFLGNCYYLGRGVNQDYTKAVEWYRKSAEQGVSGAQFFLGNCYYEGEGVNQDYTKAVEWYRKSAEQGVPGAQFFLGNCYYEGEGVNQDYSQAISWYLKAAEQGDENAKNRLKEIEEVLEIEESRENNEDESTEGSRNDIEDRVKSVIVDKFDVDEDEVTLDADLAEDLLKGKLASALEEEFDITLSENDYIDTIEEIVDCVYENEEEERKSEIEESVKEVIVNLFDVDEDDLSAETDLSEDIFKGKCLSDLIEALEEEFNITISEDDANFIDTIEEIVDCVFDKLSEEEEYEDDDEDDLREDIEDRVKNVIVDKFDVDEDDVTLDADLAEDLLKGKLASALEEEFDITLSENDYIDTIEEIVDCVYENEEEERKSEIEESVKEFIVNLFDVDKDDLSAETDLSEDIFKGKCLSDLIEALEEEFDITISEDDIDTVGEVVDCILDILSNEN